MLPLEQQVCGLNLAKNLKELGVKQKSVFYWCNPYKNEKFDLKMEPEMCNYGEYWFSAFTVSELIKIFPKNWTVSWQSTINDGKEEVFFEVIDQTTGNNYHTLYPFEISMADACAESLAYLLKNKIITL